MSPITYLECRLRGHEDVCEQAATPVRTGNSSRTDALLLGVLRPVRAGSHGHRLDDSHHRRPTGDSDMKDCGHPRGAWCACVKRISTKGRDT
jgi:hypothetical protein